MTVVSSATTTPVSVTSGYFLETSSGSIIEDNTDAYAITSFGTNDQLTIDGFVYGAGTVDGVFESGVGVYVTGISNSLTVNGLIQGDTGIELIQTNTSVTIGSQGSVEDLNRWGVAIMGSESSPASTFSTLNNAGFISGEGPAVLAIDGGNDIINNSGTLSGGLGVCLSANVATETVNNSGAISAGYQENGSAIYCDDSTAGVDIVNTGSITNSNANVAGGGWGALLFEDHSGTTSVIHNTGTISGLGYVIQSVSDILNIENAGTIQGGLYSTASVDIDNTGVWQDKLDTAIFELKGAHNTVTNSQAGVIDGPISMASGSGDTIYNAGAINGWVAMAAGGDTFTNSGSIEGSVALAGSGTGDTLTDTGVIHGNVTLAAGDTFILGDGGSLSGWINTTSGDVIEFGGNFGNRTIINFIAGSGSTHDTVQFATNDFSTFSQVQAASTQQGANVVIRLDGADTLTLSHVTLSSLVSQDFKFA